MHDLTFTFEAELWVYQGKGAWHFLTLPKAAADEIRFFNPTLRGFNPLKVTAKIGKTIWKTAIFPDSKSDSFVLAVKKEVRDREKLCSGDCLSATITIATGS